MLETLKKFGWKKTKDSRFVEDTHPKHYFLINPQIPFYIGHLYSGVKVTEIHQKDLRTYLKVIS